MYTIFLVVPRLKMKSGQDECWHPKEPALAPQKVGAPEVVAREDLTKLWDERLT